MTRRNYFEKKALDHWFWGSASISRTVWFCHFLKIIIIIFFVGKPSKVGLSVRPSVCLPACLYLFSMGDSFALKYSFMSSSDGLLVSCQRDFSWISYRESDISVRSRGIGKDPII